MEFIPREATIRPLRDKILVRPLAWEPSKILEVVRHGRPLRGEVIAVGPGSHPKKYKAGPKGPRSLMDYSKYFQPTEVKPGDIVELGGLSTFDGAGYAFTEIVHGTETLLICSENDVCGIVDG
jgi:co-chaperonin GroES (HSP10)